ncbi:sugar-binding domain-containing protein [uncultured Maribacter sp.]|uniref:sugar-binding domain-containing protein n=1 Tax=uncultured Maribacter sp. TaxID=431308 RepID=UPI00262EAE7D|nr:sugar-binding domain-containing protein [uncultured Maribacter sp.]
MKTSFVILVSSVILLIGCNFKKDVKRITQDFNKDWKFRLGDESEAFQMNYEDDSWKTINVPHDWSIEEGYKNVEETAASTGFTLGGIGWYRKSFRLNKEDVHKHISILFDGVYNNSSVWLNGNLLGTRPNGYSSFQYNLTPYLKHGDSLNVLAVKVDHSAYVDSRWYTGSGIYRKVQLIKKSPLHIANWGVRITTPKITKEYAEINIETKLENTGIKNPKNITLRYAVQDSLGVSVAFKEITLKNELQSSIKLEIKKALLWSVENPNLYTLKVEVLQDGTVVDNVSEKFGVRSFNFDANKGFSLNGKSMKIKGVNIHHDAGALGAAVPKGIWEYRMEKLKSVGVNAIRLSHNPHAVELLEVCDALGLLVMNEAFDEWHLPKGKSKVYLGDNAASEEASKAYPEHFKEWAERDLKDLIKRDFNHPSVIMWSIGNEIEWTFPEYSKTFNEVNKDIMADSYHFTPKYDSIAIKAILKKNVGANDELANTAKQLVKWVKEEDISRPVTCGSVLPSVSIASGYGKAVDVLGFNYRAADYDAAHKTYPDLKILGSENWVDYMEWKNCLERDFVSGVFLWTGFAYLGEAGPWPRKGLNISLFDFAGFKNPRGHFFECLWKEDSKVYMVTTPANESEFSFDKKKGWEFNMQLTPPPVWKMLRKWEWYKVYSKWKYDEGEPIIVQTYTNCEEAELFLNSVSLGKQKLSDFNEDNIIKWQVPFTQGELKVVGYNNGIKEKEYMLHTNSDEVAKISLKANKEEVYVNDITVITAKLLDDKGNLITTADKEIVFSISDNAKIIGIDNGWEKNVQSHKSNGIITHQGKAILIVQTKKEKGIVKISATVNGVKSKEFLITVP